MAIIRVYTKQIIKEEYDFGLAASVHFCMAWGDSPAVELNQGCGILFPEGIIKEDNTIDARGISDPIVSRDKESFYIAGKYVNDSIEETAPGKLYVWETKDFLRFQDQGLKECSTLPLESAGSQVEIPDSMVKDILDQWTPVKAVSVEIPYNNADIADSSVCTDTVNIRYSDGSICTKPVIWTETEEPEHYAGKIQSPAYPYPLLKGFADPVFFKHEGKWYFLATNDLNGNIGLFLREADTIMGLFEEGHSCSVILDYSKEHQFIQTFWAPEWHMIGGVPYILFAVGGEKWAPQSHVMKYKGSGSIMDPGSWELPVRVRQKNGHFLTEDGITLDMIYFKAGGTSYVVWSERYHIGSPLDSGSMLYIATIDEKDPTILTSEKVLLSRPLYGWENVAGTINNEGPYALLRRGQVYLSYSGGAAVGHTCAVGFLTADQNADLLDVKNWRKMPSPALHAYSIEGIDGPGHNSFFIDDEGNTMIAYHGQLEVRSSAIHRVHFSKNGFPVLNMSVERDLPAQLREVRIQIKKRKQNDDQRKSRADNQRH